MSPLRELEINRLRMMAESLGWTLVEMKHGDKSSSVVLKKVFPEELLKREEELKPRLTTPT